MSGERMPYLGGSQLWDANETSQAQVTSFIQPQLRLIHAAAPRIGDFAQPGAVRFRPFVRYDRKSALRTPVDIRRHWLGWLAIDPNDYHWSTNQQRGSTKKLAEKMCDASYKLRGSDARDLPDQGLNVYLYDLAGTQLYWGGLESWQPPW